ncbi:hypothetical protein ACP70R_006255 [Stipagrostis hirtigluma subsp. patula]
MCLKVNYRKSVMVPINVPAQKMEILSRTFNCQIGSLPFTYLGLPLGLEKPSVAECYPLVQRVERRMIACSQFLTQARRLQMVNSVLSSLPTFYMCSISIPVTVLDQIDKYRRHCLWRGSDPASKKPPLVSWDMVCKPKKHGGLGVIDLRVQNKALLMKNLHKFYNKSDLPWVSLVWESYYSNGKLPSDRKIGSFWWKDVLKLQTEFKGMASCLVNNGASIYFWHDLWNGCFLPIQFPELYSYAKKKDISFLAAMGQDTLLNLFHQPLSVEAYNQFQRLEELVQNIQLTNDHDTWIYIWGNVESVAHLFIQCRFAKECWGMLDLTYQDGLEPFRVLEILKAKLQVPFFMEVGGFIQQYERGFTFASVRGAGQSVPSFQPKGSLVLFSSFLKGVLPATVSSLHP